MKKKINLNDYSITRTQMLELFEIIIKRSSIHLINTFYKSWLTRYWYAFDSINLKIKIISKLSIIDNNNLGKGLIHSQRLNKGTKNP